MNRSEINKAIASSVAFFEKNGWVLPPDPRWDVTDFGLGKFSDQGLVLINLAEEPEYCEKLMYSINGQTTPAHTHKKKKEDIICRNGALIVRLWPRKPNGNFDEGSFDVKINGIFITLKAGTKVHLSAGERVTIEPGIWHEFYPASEKCIIGEVSTANDDVGDNYFLDPDIGRYTEINEDEPAVFKLLSDKQ